MNLERPELRLVREKLESVLAPALASSVLFEALADGDGRPPSTGEGTLAFVKGPLARVLARKIRGETGTVIVKDLTEMLEAIVGPQLTPVSPAHRNKVVRDMDVTFEITRDKGAVPVLVLASQDALAARLEAALGPGRISTRTVSTKHELEGQLKKTSFAKILLVDAIEFPSIEPVALAALLQSSPPGTIHAIWGADLAYGSVLLGELLEKRVPATPLDRREGIEPLLDLVRSRRG